MAKKSILSVIASDLLIIRLSQEASKLALDCWSSEVTTDVLLKKRGRLLAMFDFLRWYSLPGLLINALLLSMRLWVIRLMDSTTANSSMVPITKNNDTKICTPRALKPAPEGLSDYKLSKKQCFVLWWILILFRFLIDTCLLPFGGWRCSSR